MADLSSNPAAALRAILERLSDTPRAAGGDLAAPIRPLLPPIRMGMHLGTSCIPNVHVDGNRVLNPDGTALSFPEMLADSNKAIKFCAAGPLMALSHTEFNLALDLKGEKALDPKKMVHGPMSHAAVRSFQFQWNTAHKGEQNAQLRNDGEIDAATLVAVVKFNDAKYGRTPPHAAEMKDFMPWGR